MSSGQTIDFSEASETLNLTDALGCGGVLIGQFVAGDKLDLNGAWSFSRFNDNAPATVGTQTPASGANQIAPAFARELSQSSFSVNGGGATVIGRM